MKERMSATIPGKPMTWSRVRVNTRGGKVLFFPPDDRKQRMGEIALFWRAAKHERIAKPAKVALRCEFIFDRPDNHFGTGRNAGVLKDTMRYQRPGAGKNGGDLDNLVKLVKDALNHVAYEDDSQIAELQATKRYVEPGEVAETRITIVRLDTGEELGELPEHKPAQLELAAA
jgi:Holliday junction resolvase RusA-like endonuclease